MKTKTIVSTLMLSSLLVATGFTHAAVIIPTDYIHATGLPGPEPNAGDDSATTRLNDDVISAGSWSDGLHVSWGQGTIPATDPTATITFLFDQTYDFDTVDIYQYTTTWGAQDVRLSTSTDNVNFTSTTGIIPIGTGTAVGGSTQRFTIDVTGLDSGQYVRLDLMNANSWIMLSEVDFNGTAIPEPSAALLGGLGLLALLRRRRA